MTDISYDKLKRIIRQLSEESGDYDQFLWVLDGVVYDLIAERDIEISGEEEYSVDDDLDLLLT